MRPTERVELAPSEPFEDPDPWPRDAPVGSGSAFASVSVARRVAPGAPRLEPARATADRRAGTLGIWSFHPAGEPDRREVVSLPDHWSRRDPGLCDFRGPAVYERTVEASGPFARVVLDSVDYVATVSVDGEQRAVHEGAFVPVAVDVPVGRRVRVSVLVDDPVEPSLLTPMPILKPKRKIKGVHELHDSRPGGLPIGPWFTPTWGRRWGTGGITERAWLHESGPVRIDAVFATAEPRLLRVSWVLTNLGKTSDAELVATLGGTTVTVPVTLAPGASRVSVRLDASGAQAWSPDRPVTYTLRTAAYCDGVVSDASETVVGFRTVSMDTTGPAPLRLHLDGRPVYVRAANYIPGVWIGELTEDTIRRDVHLARAANLNSLGVHAGVQPRVFGHADAAGILVYQDFPLQWAYDPDGGPLVDGGPTFAEASLFLAAELVYRFYNHPSLVYWCGHNEPAYQLAEMNATAGDQRPSWFGRPPDEDQLDRRRHELLERVDPSRPAIVASGLGWSRPGHDHHDYAGSFVGGHPTDAVLGEVAFVSEYGAWSADFSAAASAACARGDWPPPPGSEIDWYVRTHIYSTQTAFAGRPELYEDFQTWCFAGQLWAAWYAKVTTEKARLAKFAPSAGQRYHFFLDHWGEAGGGVVDRHRVPQLPFRALAAANRPVVPLAPFPRGGRVRPGDTVSLPVVVVNDLDAGGRRVLRWRLAALGPDDAFLVGADPHPGGPQVPRDHCAVIPRRFGETLLEGTVDVDVAVNAVTPACVVEWRADRAGPVALFMNLEGIAGWTSFVVAPDGWTPERGLTGPRKFRVTTDEPSPLRRLWTGEDIDPSAAQPDQYLLGEVRVDVFDDTHVATDRLVASPLPWRDPLAYEPTS